MLATNSPIHQNLALHPRQHPSRSYVLGFEVPKVHAIPTACSREGSNWTNSSCGCCGLAKLDPRELLIGPSPGPGQSTLI